MRALIEALSPKRKFPAPPGAGGGKAELAKWFDRAVDPESLWRDVDVKHALSLGYSGMDKTDRELDALIDEVGEWFTRWSGMADGLTAGQIAYVQNAVIPAWVETSALWKDHLRERNRY